MSKNFVLSYELLGKNLYHREYGRFCDIKGICSDTNNLDEAKKFDSVEKATEYLNDIPVQYKDSKDKYKVLEVEQEKISL